MFNQMDVDAEEYQVGCMHSPRLSAVALLVLQQETSSLLPFAQLKPMNCPFHISVYKQGYHSYRDLPFRWAELGTGKLLNIPARADAHCLLGYATTHIILFEHAVYRYERSGTMHGLFRVRGFTQAIVSHCNFDACVLA